MKNELFGIISLVLIFGFLLAGCSRVSAEEDSESVPAESRLSGQPDTVNMQQAQEGETGSECLVLFYQTFKSGYSYTRIGKILKPQGLEKALGEGEIKITISHFRG